MKTILIYLLQMIIASGLLYGYYHFFLRNKKFHRYNRYYLLMAVVVSIVIPFINIPVYFSQEATDNSVVLQTLNVFSSSNSEDAVVVSSSASNVVTSYNWFSWQNILYALYILFVLVLIIRVILSVRKIKIITSSYPSEKIGDINFVNTTEPGTPFSFFRWLFWNKEIELDSDKGQQIFRHELFHINQKHSYDIFLMELITAFAWFNPFFHLIKKELKTIHEFLADEYAMNKVESWQYAELLLMQALNTKHHLVNPFFHNQIRRRIAMITSSQKPGHQYLRKLLVLPVAVVITALFAFSYKNRKAENDSLVKSKDPITIVVDAGHGGNDSGAKSVEGKYTEAELTLEISKLIQALSKDYNINVVMTREDDKLPGGATTISEGLNKRIEIVNQVNPKAYVSIHLNSFGKPGKTTDQTGVDIYISVKNGNKRNALGSMVHQEVEKIYSTSKSLKLTENRGFFILDSLNIPSIVVECGFINNPKDLAFIIDKANQEKIARAILNGVSKFANQDNLKDAINKAVRNEIKLAKEKSQSTTDTPKIKKVEVTLVDTTPLVFIDGKLHGKLDTRKLDSEVSPNDIESITVLKNAEATKLYGAEAKHGVILIYTKKYVEKHPEIKNEQEAQRNKYNKPTPPLQEVVVTGFKSNKLVNNDPIFVQVETAPSFPGGKDGWRKYLEQNLNALVPLEKGAKAGTYTVMVKFIVDKQGEISAIEGLTNHGFGMEDEVIRVISKGPKWEPAKQNGHVVSAYHQQPVTFVITEDTDEEKTNPIITEAPKIENTYPNISLKDLQKATATDLINPKAGTEIISFVFTTDNDNGTITEVFNSGSTLNQNLKDLIKESKPGRTITIDNIYIQESGVRKKVPSKVYFVK